MGARGQVPDHLTTGHQIADLDRWLNRFKVDPPSRSHDLVTQLSLKLSGRSAPYTRWAMHRHAALQQPPALRPDGPPRRANLTAAS